MYTSKINDILTVIEEWRNEMHQKAAQYGFTHSSVITISEKIDEKVNEYNRLVYLKQTV